MDLFWPRKNRERHLKALDVTTLYSYSVHDNGGNTSNLLLHLKISHSTFHEFVKSEIGAN